MAKEKQVIGGTVVVNGRKLSLSRAVRAGEFVYLTGRMPVVDGKPVTTGTIEEQTRLVLDLIRDSLAEAGCEMRDVVKTMVWLRDRADFPGFNEVFADYFPDDPPARSAVISELLLDVRVEIEAVAWRPLE